MTSHKIGFYWVRILPDVKPENDLTIAEFDGGCWWVMGDGEKWTLEDLFIVEFISEPRNLELKIIERARYGK